MTQHTRAGKCRRLFQTMATTAFGLIAGPALAGDVTLRLSHWLPPNHPIATQALKPWMDSITAASGGSITFEVFPAGQLGKAEDHYDLARDGIADVAWLNPGFNAGRFPVFAATQIPMTISDGLRGMAGVNDFYARYADVEMPDARFCLANVLAPISFYSTKRIERPSDLAGLKVRPSSAMEAAFIRGAGGSTVAGTNPEAREMLSRGIIDASTGVPNSNILFGVTDVTQHVLDLPFAAVVFALVLNKDSYAAMDAGQRSVIDAHCTSDAAMRFFSVPQQIELQGLERIRAEGKLDVVTPSAATVAEWKALSGGVIDQWKADVRSRGHDADAVLSDLQSALRARDALID
ncbi:TRAP transporter substrate-binding protein [Gemmobacter sp.]|uniref:TRAP transporter substrate-binding protein n=1 Tax=Gemmobacter sp. TaxID=1898957 RepID=UPI002AFF7FFC|nr:TRAP transporter substrate-binding protein [Gemmobacter sp.]